MPDSSAVFPLWHIALTAAIGFAASFVVLWAWGKRSGTMLTGEVAAVSLVVAFSILAWRLAGNVAQLNDDPVPLFSPNDLLCPIVSYVMLGVYAAFRRPADLAHWERARALLTIVSFVVNVVII
jgi:hypothetical protein